MPSPINPPPFPLGKGFKWWYAWSAEEHTLRAYRSKRNRELACRQDKRLRAVTYEEYQRFWQARFVDQYGQPKCWQEPKEDAT